jgi:hypothetical protein
MKDETHVLVSRRWDNPNITVAITRADISIAMSVEDFVTALALEVGNPTFLMTTAGLKTALQAAATNVVEGMKAETARVVE